MVATLGNSSPQPRSVRQGFKDCKLFWKGEVWWMGGSILLTSSQTYQSRHQRRSRKETHFLTRREKTERERERAREMEEKKRDTGSGRRREKQRWIEGKAELKSKEKQRMNLINYHLIESK